MELVLVVMMIALIEYMVFAGLVGRARAVRSPRARTTAPSPSGSIACTRTRSRRS
jgi:hypothetical protein